MPKRALSSGKNQARNGRQTQKEFFMKKMAAVARALTIAVVSLLWLAGCRKDAAPRQLPLIFAHNQKSVLNPYSYGSHAFKEKIGEISGGTISVECMNGTLAEDEDELVKKMQMGAASIVVVSPGFMASLGIPEVDMLSLPYLFESADHWKKNVDGQFGKELSEIVRERSGNHFRILGYWSASVRNYYGKKAVRAPEDLAGLRIRTQPSTPQMQFWKACGAEPSVIPWSEMEKSLEKELIDAAENDYTNILLNGHHKMRNGTFISETNHDFTTRFLLMDGALYDSLSAQQKAWIDEAAQYATELERERAFEMESISKWQVTEDGATITERNEVDIGKFTAIAVPIQDDFAERTGTERLLRMVRGTK